MHILAFILLTEPCLNPSYTTRLLDKLDYFSLLSSPTAIPAGEWGGRFGKAGVRGLFGVGVVQVWFVSRLNGYVQRAEREHGRIVGALKKQRKGGKVTGIDSRYAEEEGEGTREVGNFIRQLESVSVTFLGLPFVGVAMGMVCVVMGAPVSKWKETATLAFHLTLLIAFPLVHVLGLPDTTTTTSSTETTTTSENTSSSTTNLLNPSTHWSSLLTLKPNPTFLLPLYYPLIGCFLATLLSTAVLALDWNVSYQTYPFPLLVGSLVGVVLGDMYTIGTILFD